MTSRLKEKYQKEILPQLKKELELKNVHAVPHLQKVVVNVGMGDMSKNKEMATQAKQDLATITGQAPSVRQAHISVASFSLRRGMPVGLKVTLRGERMYAFLDKLINIVLPKVRDFRGVSPTAFDNQGNYNLGMREQVLFPEVDYKNVDKIRGMQITINTNSQSVEQGRRFLELMGMPFMKMA
jgi:large subunit ribosomal protein L5